LQTKLDITDANDPQYEQKKNLIDELYKKSSGGEILKYLIDEKLLPEKRKGNKDVVKECATFKDLLAQRKMQIEQQKSAATFENFQAGITEQRLQLEAKPNKTEDEIRLLQSYLYLEQNPQASQAQFETSLAAMDDTTLYMGIGSMARKCLIGSFTDL
jgi:hypothetical protein